MAFVSKNFQIKGEDFRVLYNTTNQEIWFQHLPEHSALGFLSTSSLHVPVGQQGHEDMADFAARLKTWLNSMLDKYFNTTTVVVVTPVADPIDKQIEDLITQQLQVSGDLFI